MRVLVTNDDGVDSVGLHALARVAVEAGCEVVVAAPHTERSGSSASLTVLEADGRMIVHEQVPPEGLGDVPMFGVEATPAFIAMVAAEGAFGEAPELVLSGINRGPNTGYAILHSGTVGAALTASTHGTPSLAVSLIGTKPTHFDTAAIVASETLAWMLANPIDEDLVLNVNVPDIPAGQLKGLRRAELAAFGAVEGRVGEHGRGYVTITFSEVHAEPEPGTDLALVEAGWATITPLRAPCHATDHTAPEWTGNRSTELASGRERG